MDNFKMNQLHKIGIGGLDCSCCNNKGRTKNDNVDKKLNRMARARIKRETMSLIKTSIIDGQYIEEFNRYDITESMCLVQR